MALDIFHYNERTQEYKSLNMNLTDDRSGCFISINTGSKTEKTKNRIALRLSKQELAYLALEAQKLYEKMD